MYSPKKDRNIVIKVRYFKDVTCVFDLYNEKLFIKAKNNGTASRSLR